MAKFKGDVICVPFITATSSKGIWFNENPLDYKVPAALLQIILCVVTSRLLYVLLKPLGQTKFTCNLLAGVILGPSLFTTHPVLREKVFGLKDMQVWAAMGMSGMIYSLFLIAIKVDISMVKRTKVSFKIGALGFIVTIAVSLGLGIPLKSYMPGIKGEIFPFFMFTILSFSFFPSVAQALDDLNLMNSELGQLAMSSILFVEILQWLISMGQNIATKDNVSEGVLTFLFTLIMALVIIFAIRPLMLWIVKSTQEGQEVKEVYVVAILLGALFLAFVSDAIGCFLILGPILLGLVIPDGPPLGAAIIAKSEFLVSEFLLPIFYFRIGFRADINSIKDWKSFTTLQAIIVATYLAKVLAVTVGALCCKISLRNSILLGVMMNIRGIIEIVMFSGFKFTKALDDQSFANLVLSVLLGNMISTSLLHFTYKAHLRLGASSPKGPRIRNIQSVQRNCPFDILCCIHTEQTIRNLTSILEASNPTEESPICAYVIQAVELVGRAIPVLVPYKKKREGQKYSLLNSLTHQMMQAFKNYSENSRGPVLIESFTMIAPYKSMHETICRLVDDNHVPFVVLPFHDNHSQMVCNTVTTAIRQFNKNMLQYSSCTIGLLVERGLPGPVTMSHFSYNVAAFFIGGPDDREALALAARMLGNRNVAVTVYRIRIVQQGKYNEDEENETRLDDAMVDEFKLSTVGNGCLKWRDIEVEDTIQLTNAVMDSQGDYDLVMVGRRHADYSLRDEEMSEFVHYAELGMIGDMLASSDFCGGMVNVLVLQESTELSINYGSAYGSDFSKNLGFK